MSRLGPASSTSPSSSTTFARSASSAGASRARRMRASCSTRSSRPCANVVRSFAAASCITRDRGMQYVSIKYTERLTEAGVEAVRRQRRRQLRQRPRRDHQRTLQSRGDLAARAVAQLRGGRVRHARMGRLVQQRRLLEPIGNIPPAEAEARYYAQIDGSRHGGVTQPKWPPANPGRFTPSEALASTSTESELSCRQG